MANQGGLAALAGVAAGQTGKRHAISDSDHLDASNVPQAARKDAPVDDQRLGLRNLRERVEPNDEDATLWAQHSSRVRVPIPSQNRPALLSGINIGAGFGL